MKKKLVALLAGAMFMMAGSAMATMWPSTDGTWTSAGPGSTITDYLSLSYFSASGVTLVSPIIDFSGTWAYTAIAHESGNINLIEQPVASNPGAGYGGTNVTFTTTTGYTNWGAWSSVNFDNTNLYFEDSSGPYNVKLDPFNATSTPGFKVYQLTNDSTVLNYLSNPTLIKAGSYVIGFNDNSATGDGNDSDYDDIIIAITPVPEPGTIALLGFGMLGLAVFGKRRMNKNA